MIDVGEISKNDNKLLFVVRLLAVYVQYNSSIHKFRNITYNVGTEI